MSAQFASQSEAVRAALDELAMNVLGEIRKLESAIKANDSQGDPDYKSEVRYYTAHYNAYNKALFHWDKGLRPTQAANGDWLIPSGSTGGLVHRVSREGNVWLCGPSCKATAFHWHQALIEALERAEELMDLHDDLDAEPLPTPADLGARLAAARAAKTALDELFA